MMNPQNGMAVEYRATSPYRRAVVQAVHDTTSDMFDVKYNNTFVCSNITPDGRIPQVNDYWICSNELGAWNFHSLARSATTGQVLATQDEIINLFGAIEGFTWAPYDSPTGYLEAPSGVLIGERRLFEFNPGPDWVRLNGSKNVLISAYRPLYELYGTIYGVGDLATQFAVPNIDANAAVFIPTFGGGIAVNSGQQLGVFVSPAAFYARAR